MQSNLFQQKYTVFTILSVLSLTASLFQYISIQNNRKESIQDAIRDGNELAKKSANDVDSLLYGVYLPLIEYASTFNDTIYPDSKNVELLLDYANELTGTLGLTLCYLPFEYDSTKKLYCPFYNKLKDTLIYVGELYDYSDKNNFNNSNWFYSPLEKSRFWSEPGYGPAAGEVVVDLGIPIKRKGRNIAILDATFTLSAMTQIIKGMSIGKSGYGFLLSKDGKLVAHPNFSTLKELKNIRDFAEDNFDEKLIPIASKMQHQEIGFDDYLDPISGLESWIFYHPIKTSEWSIGVMLHKNEVNLLSREIINSYAILSITILVCLISIVIPLTDGFNIRNLWTLSLITSIILGFGVIFLLWLNSIATQNISSDEMVSISNNVDLTNLKNKIENNIKLRRESHPYFIKTGIQIHNVKILGAETIGLSGSIWQEYPKKYPRDLEIGFDFKDVSTDAEASYIELINTSETDNSILYNWKFRISIINSSDYELYPFDEKNVYLEITPKAFGRNIYLVPAIDNYSFLNFSSSPGVDVDIPLIGWDIHGSFFSVNFEDVKTTYGQKYFEYSSEYPFLNFNISLKRNISSPIISYFIPIFILLIMLFAVLRTVSKKNVEISGFNSFGVVSTAAAFFFVAILSHIDLRSKLGIEELTYLEYFYFVTYFYILLVTVNSILFTDNHYFHLVDFNNNIYPKLIFWPMYLVIVYSFTFYTFYS